MGGEEDGEGKLGNQGGVVETGSLTSRRSIFLRFEGSQKVRKAGKGGKRGTAGASADRSGAKRSMTLEMMPAKGTWDTPLISE